MFCFDDPPKLQLPFQTSQQINRSPTGEKWAKRHSEPTHPPDMPTRNLPSLLQIPVPGRSLVQPKHVMQMKKNIGNIFGVLGFFLASPEIVKSVVTFHPPKRNRCRCPRFAISFFFRRRRVHCSLDLLGLLGFFRPQPSGSDMKVSLLCVTVNDMDVSKNSGTPKSSILIGFSIITIHFGVLLFLETPIYLWQFL